MIVTVTVNPALDRTVVLDGPLRPGQVQVAASVREDAGGKGINVSRVLAAAGQPTRAVLPLAADDPLRTALAAQQLDVRAVATAGHCRTNIALTDPAGVTTKVNLPGTAFSPAEADALVAAVVVAAEHARWLVLAGSLPPSVPDDFYVTLIRAVREKWQDAAPRVAVDTSGAALQAVVEHARPDLIKPNDDELAELTGMAPDGADLVPASLSAARTLVPARVGAALVTLGAAGTLLVTEGGAFATAAPRIQVRSTVGAGDSALAGYLLAETAGRPPEQCVVSATRHGAAAASLPGTRVPRPQDLPTDDLPVQHFPF
ncbi:hexose kinase [Microbacterium kribbense]|uniref:Hexose kinase n=1 Tax=Microbacterium kribbense TaxID=433645 RepID=A0ABP7G173_9MICO